MLAEEVGEAYELGIPGVLLFGLPAEKDAVGSEAYDPEGIIQEAIRVIKRDVPDMLVITDVCLCEYTDHGHCGIVDNGHVDNDASLELLARAETINDILVVQDRLDFVRGQIEQVVGRINLLDNLTDLATITVHLSPVALAVEPASGGGSLTPAEAFENAWQASPTVLEGIAIAALVVVAFSWWLVPPLAALAIGTRWWINRTPRVAVETPAS